MAHRTKIRAGLRALLGVLLIVQGANHFVADAFMARMIPAYLPQPYLLVYLSGVAEIVLGAMLFAPKLRRLAGWGIIALLIAVFPANLQMALHPQDWPDIPAAGLWARLPFQLLFVYWTWAVSLAHPPAAPDSKSSE